MSLSPVTVELKAGISEFKAKLKEAGHEVDHLAKKGGSTFEKFSAVGKASMLGIGGVAVGLGTVSLEMADKFEVSHAKLEAALAATGGNFEEIKGRVDEATQKMAHFGFTSAETESALAQFTISTGSSTAGFKQLGLAADLAKFKNIGLADASLAVAKAMEGNLRPLKQLGIDLPVATGGALKLQQAHQSLALATDKLNAFLLKHKDAVNSSSKSHAAYVTLLGKVHNAQTKLTDAQGASAKILDVLHQKLGGQAATAAETFAGKTAAAKAEVENLSAKLGIALIPLIEKAASIFMVLADWVQKNSAWLKPLVAIVLSAGAAFILINKAIAVTNVVLRALGVAEEIALGPIGLIIIAIAALTAGLIYAYNHSETFRQVVQTAFSAVSSACSAMWNFIKPIFKFLIDAWLGVAGALIHGAAEAFGWVPGIGPKLKAAAKAFESFAKQANAALGSIQKDIHVNVNADVTLHQTDQTGRTIGGVLTPQGRATGGSVVANMPYLVGENTPEMFVPNQAGRMLNMQQLAGLAGRQQSAGPQVIENKLYLDGKQIHSSLLDLRRNRGQGLGLA